MKMCMGIIYGGAGGGGHKFSITYFWLWILSRLSQGVLFVSHLDGFA